MCKGPVINYREARGRQNGRGGQVKFYPYKKRGEAEKVLAMLKVGRGTNGLGVVLTRELEVLAILVVQKKLQKYLPCLEGGRQKVLSCLSGGGVKRFGPVIFPFCRPPFSS